MILLGAIPRDLLVNQSMRRDGGGIQHCCVHYQVSADLNSAKLKYKYKYKKYKYKYKYKYKWKYKYKYCQPQYCRIEDF